MDDTTLDAIEARQKAAASARWEIIGGRSQRSDYAVAWPCETAVALAGTTGEGE